MLYVLLLALNHTVVNVAIRRVHPFIDASFLPQEKWPAPKGVGPSPEA